VTRASFTVQWARRGARRDEGICLIERQFEKYYKVKPHVPEELLVAILDGHVVATIVVELMEHAEISLLELYDIPHTSLPKTPLMQWSRLSCVAPMGTTAVFWAAAEYSLRMQRGTGFLEAKQYPADSVGREGLQLHPVPGARFIQGRAHPSALTYYQTPPVPVLYRFDAVQVHDNYAGRIREADVEVVFA